MHRKIIVFCYRSADDKHKESYYAKYDVEVLGPTSALNVMQDIFEKFDYTFGFLNHATCGQGVCNSCIIKINGSNCMACTTDISNYDILVIEPVSTSKFIKI